MFTRDEKVMLEYKQKSTDLVAMASYIHFVLESTDVIQAADAPKIMIRLNFWIACMKEFAQTLHPDMFLLIGLDTGWIFGISGHTFLLSIVQWKIYLDLRRT